jgi:H/ACA ribonucleoprotein complex non-core subunit NAF1
MASLPGLVECDDLVAPSPKRVKLQETRDATDENVYDELDDADFYGTPDPVDTTQDSSVNSNHVDSLQGSAAISTSDSALPGLDFATTPCWQQTSTQQPSTAPPPAIDVEDGEIAGDITEDFYGDEDQKTHASRVQEPEVKHADLERNATATAKSEVGREPPKLADPPSPRLQQVDGGASAPIKNRTSIDGDHELREQDAEFREAAKMQEEDPNAEWRLDSSDAESSDAESDSSSSSDEEDSSDEEGLLDPHTQAKMLLNSIVDDDDDDDEEPRTAQEICEDFLPKPDIVVKANEKITELGNVDGIINNLILIKANTSGDYRVLDSGSVLCLSDRTVIGAVTETIGKVQNPMYSMGVKDLKELEEAGIAPGTTVYYVDAHAKFVFTQELKATKGSDDLNGDEGEAEADELYFSDDEKEAEYLQKIKNEKKMKAHQFDRPTDRYSNGPSHTSRARPPHPDSYAHQPASPQIKYDEEDDEEMYRPLKRPDNLHEMMPFHEPIENRAVKGRPFHRGGRRGGQAGFNDRGRGGRFRGATSPPRGGANRGAQRGGPQRGGKHFGGQHRGGRHQSPDRKNSRHESPQSRDPRLRGRQSAERPSSSRSNNSSSNMQAPSFPPAAPPLYSAPSTMYSAAPSAYNNAACAQDRAQTQALSPLTSLLQMFPHVNPVVLAQNLAQLPAILAQQQHQQPQHQQPQQPQQPQQLQHPQANPYQQWPQIPMQQPAPTPAPAPAPAYSAPAQQQAPFQSVYGQQTGPQAPAYPADAHAALDEILRNLPGGKSGQS